MKWFLARKAPERVLNPQQFHLHIGSKYGSYFRYVQKCESIVWSKAMEATSYCNQMRSAYSCHRYSTTREYSKYRLFHAIINENKKVDLEIISRETIKPSSPTPHHLRIFNLSIIDQILYDYYTPIILFIPNSNKASVNYVMSKRSKHLKETLSYILSRFYPFSGELKDRLHIECNDKGVNYIEARVNQTLDEFLCHLDDEKVKELMIESPRSPESSIGNYVLGIQINIFNCGGIGISTSMSHKIMDFHTYKVFMKAWAAAVRGAQETISPSFMASEIFPNDPSLEYSIPSELTTNTTISTKRFVFDPKSVAALKAKLAQCTLPVEREPTRMEATTALIWKVAAKASSTVTPFSPQSPYALLSIVNLLKKASPPLTENAIGNITVLVSAVCFPESQPDLATLTGELRESMASANLDYIESLKGEKRTESILGRLNGLSNLANIQGDFIMASSVLNSGIYELDFGWGKPIWFNVLNTGNASLVFLTDTHKRGGVEATVSLSPDKMKIFERDRELLSYASVNPSPLLSLNH
ncbi:epi-neemfruitin B 7-O-acetyltransferse L7AT-like [Rutidosis leptorrhynchoides]|uniref:epi-neemfruitin B 7-O-acetyltransferse L7AT-like n=1 Tax=Rutidosis leptorrhynchoides TaxID=125765 RepID=UPI003A9A523E